MEIIPAIFIGFGLFIIFHTVIKNEKDMGDFLFQKNVLTAMVLIAIGGYILYAGIGGAVIKKKLIGLILTLFGFFLVFKFPWSGWYNRGMDGTAMFFGVIILIVGLVMLIF